MGHWFILASVSSAREHPNEVGGGTIEGILGHVRLEYTARACTFSLC